MGTENSEKHAGDRTGDEKNVTSRALATLERTRLRRATDVYDYIVDTLYDHGAHSLSVKEVNTNLTGTRLLLSTVQTVHRLQREAGIVQTSPQLAEFSQSDNEIMRKTASRKQIAKEAK